MSYGLNMHMPQASHRACIQAMFGLSSGFSVSGRRRVCAMMKRQVWRKQAAGSSVCLTASTVKIAATLCPSATASSSAEINSAATPKLPYTGKFNGPNCGEIKPKSSDFARDAHPTVCIREETLISHGGL